MKKKKTKVKNRNEIEAEKDNKEKKIIYKEDEEKIQVIVEKEIAKKKVPKQISQAILKKICKNLILAIVIMIYFISCNIVYTQVEWKQMETITKTISGIFLLVSIILF